MIDARGLCQRLTPCGQLALCKGALGTAWHYVRQVPSAWHPVPCGVVPRADLCVPYKRGIVYPMKHVHGIPTDVVSDPESSAVSRRTDMDLCNGDSNLRVRASFSS